jgi:endonuclease/exonuclease/phosphatase family metal-dependent hydrolase
MAIAAQDDRAQADAAPAGQLRLRLLSYNIQVGMHTGHYGHYVTRAWQHVMPSPGLRRNLDRIADLMLDYDFVAIQEADAGSMRTRYVNQLEHLALRAGFPHWGLCVTRDLQPMAQHCLGYLSRFEPRQVTHHTLPSRIPGRRAMTIELGPDAGGLTLLIAHLSLGRDSQRRQLDYISGLVAPSRPTVLLGDLNCEPAVLRRHAGLRRSGLTVAANTPPTFPSWRPRRCIDHILVSKDVRMENLQALQQALSDHRPLAADIGIALPQ